MVRGILEHHYKGQMKEFCPLISDLFLFFSWHLWLISHFRSKFSKTKGGTLGWKKSEKIDFYVWYLERTALKNVDWKWNRFLKILIFMEVMDLKVPKNRHFEQIWGFRAFFGTFWSITSTKINIFKNRFHFQSTFFKAVLLRYQT